MGQVFEVAYWEAGLERKGGNLKYQLANTCLLFQEGPMTRNEAVYRERTLKKWSRKKKLALITNEDRWETLGGNICLRE